MVRRFFERIGVPIRGLHQAAYWLAALTLASQALALLRDRTFAASFGAGQTLDLYYAAFRVPDIVFALVSSLVSAYVLIPRITRASPESVRRLLSQSASSLLIVGGVICVVLSIFMRAFLSFLYPDLIISGHADEFVLLARLLLIQPILLGLSGVLASVTQVHRRFLLFALSPVLYNLGIIFGAIVLYPVWGLPGIGAGVILGAIAYVAVNVPVVVSARLIPRLVFPSWRTMLPVVRDSMPRSLALGMGSITALVLTVLASRLGTGAISVSTLAGNLEAVPLALIGSSYAVAAFPALSEALATDKRQEFSRILSASSRHIILWSIVSLGLIIVLRAHLVRVVLGAGAFDWDATRLTAALLAILAVGLVAQGLVLLFSRGLYAAHQSWRPLIYQLAGGAVTIGLAILLLALPSDGLPAALATLLRVGDVSGSAILLIALAATVGQIALAVLSLIALSRIAPGLATSLVRPFVHGALAAALGGAAAYGVLVVEGDIAPLTTLVAVATQGLVASIAGLAAAGLTLRLLGNEEFRDICAAFTRLAGAKAALPPSADESVRP